MVLSVPARLRERAVRMIARSRSARFSGQRSVRSPVCWCWLRGGGAQVGAPGAGRCGARPGTTTELKRLRRGQRRAKGDAILRRVGFLRGRARPANMIRFIADHIRAREGDGLR